MNEERQQLEKKIEYWIKESRFAHDEDRKNTCRSTLYLLAKQYKQLTGEHYHGKHI